MERRAFLKASGAAALGVLAAERAGAAEAAAPTLTANGKPPPRAWLEAMHDPFRDALLGAGREMPERVKTCAEPLRGPPAFDPAEVARLAAAVQLPERARWEHPLLERVERVGLAHIDLTFQRDHPKYGLGKYALARCDGFPPVIIAAVDALTLWGNFARAERLLSYWLRCFIYRDGTIEFQGPSLSEYGQLLTTIRQFVERTGNREWLAAHRDIVRKTAAWIESQMLASGKVALLQGVPEDDTRQDVATYFHNNAWLVRGLRDWAALEPAERTLRQADELHALLLAAIRERWPADPEDWWLPPTVESTLPHSGKIERPAALTANRIGTYTNYRYWLELLSSGVLPRELSERIIHARLTGGGQFLGMTRFHGGRLDDWPLQHWLEALWTLGRREDFALSLWGHIHFHQAEEHLTAYEVVTMPPGRSSTPYCLPCQLVATRAAARLALG